ncbi:uncharacterized protein LOC131659978 [Vicia villosa]|uniref:uncharacterized protein LOC131659978 n=1 Tax=Vicia villosa TaxID=3911 RepID=UPI00273BD984|nr:uncharacterized protein LOC131659978 [Vicia villosa]
MVDEVVYSLWGSKECEWSAKNSEGRSGGILTVWNKDNITPILSFRGKGYLGVKAWRKDKVIYFIKVYSPCALNEKRMLWSELLVLKNKYGDGEWIMGGGDFNAVREVEERWGRSANSRQTEIEEFNTFIDCMELLDVPVLGNKHTWINSNGTASSRLDRFLLSEEIVQSWNVMAQRFGNRDISDHRPIWILTNKLNWGPKPFKVFKPWFEHP